jgi:hypothetical protein
MSARSASPALARSVLLVTMLLCCYYVATTAPRSLLDHSGRLCVDQLVDQANGTPTPQSTRLHAAHGRVEGTPQRFTDLLDRLVDLVYAP